ncbi:MAG: deoxyribose-phosphate aldolase [Bacteroidaceae bacterium]|nr:deoxyribose-phosphate aldolase [Bacteroidaceae bacterium]
MEPLKDQDDCRIYKYLDTIDSYAEINNKTVDKALEEIIIKKDIDIEILKKIYSCIDITTLKNEDNEESVLALTESINNLCNEHPNIKNVASICIFPYFTKQVSETLEVDDVKITVVSGGFPYSQTYMEVKTIETRLALLDGANEIDIVMPLGLFEDGNWEEISDQISEIKEICQENTLKVILQTGLMKDAKTIKQAALLAMYSGADFIKTSTGKDGDIATPQAVLVMCRAIKEYYQRTGRKVGIKIAGGMKTPADAFMFYSIVEKELGKEWLEKEYLRFGTSSVANKILDIILKD